MFFWRVNRIFFLTQFLNRMTFYLKLFLHVKQNSPIFVICLHTTHHPLKSFIYADRSIFFFSGCHQKSQIVYRFHFINFHQNRHIIYLEGLILFVNWLAPSSKSSPCGQLFKNWKNFQKLKDSRQVFQFFFSCFFYFFLYTLVAFLFVSMFCRDSSPTKQIFCHNL